MLKTIGKLFLSAAFLVCGMHLSLEVLKAFNDDHITALAIVTWMLTALAIFIISLWD